MRPPLQRALSGDSAAQPGLLVPESAHRLARAWGVPDLFPDHLRDAYVAVMETLRDDPPLAGDLAGTHSLALAQAAYGALRALAAQHGWQGDTWQDLLSWCPQTRRRWRLSCRPRLPWTA